MTIPEDVIEQVRDAADIVGLVGEHVALKRTGSDYRGPCPFHGGTHRNLAVIPKKQMYYCFVCHEGGDVFTFYMKHLGMDYPTAVREVARKVGISIPERSTGGPDPREPLYSAVAVAAEWYARRLRDAADAEPARRYLQGRDFDLERLLPHGLGFAPRGDEFFRAMKQLGIEPDVLLEAGLAVRRDDASVRPRFWNRLLFPIHDLRGRVVGFGGRVLGDGEPKYLNSPDSPVFHKGKLLYHLHEAKPALRKAERAIVVEGFFDVLRLVEAEIEEVVAPLGTSLTVDQAELLKRYTQDVVLLYDSDSAGLRATFRAADVLLRAGLRVAVATPPPGEDPDTLVRAGGAEAARALVEDAVDVLERKLQLLERKGWLGSVAGRRRALDRLLPTLRAPRDAVTRDLYVGRTAEALGVSPTAVAREVGAARGTRYTAPEPPRTARRVTQARSRRGPPERDLVRVMIREPRWRDRIAQQIEQLPIDTGPDGTLLRLLAAAGVNAAAGEVIQQVDGDARTLFESLLEEQWAAPNLDAVVESQLGKIEARPLRDELDALHRQLPMVSEEEKAPLIRREQEILARLRGLVPSRWGGSYEARR